MQKIFLLFFIFFVAAFLLLQSKQSTAPEPLADPKILSQLLLGEQPDPPTDEQYAQFHGTQVTPPRLAALKQVSRVLGTTSPSDKHIEVDLTHQRVYAFQGSQKVFDFLVSTGKWGRTPTGTFHIWVKLKSVLMSGGSGADYYYLPNVPWVEFFYNDQVAKSRGFSLHGTYWHHNFGHPMSHGCVNMRTEDAAAIFAWTSPVVTDPKLWATYATADNPGTEIIIYGETPTE
jgi:lipoprotein-anchoring transpeptidase ErfK/SrfK